MNETLKAVGHQLKRFFGGELRRPLNWRMIDAIETLKETEAARDKLAPKQVPDARSDRDRQPPKSRP